MAEGFSLDANMDPSDQTISAQMMETFCALAPLLQDPSLKLTPNPRRTKAPRRGEGSSQDSAEHMHQQDKHPGKALTLLNTMAHMLIRHDQELNGLRRTDQFILFLNPDPTGALHLLIQESAAWKAQMESPTQQQKQPLRQHLVLTLLKALQTNAGKIVESKDTEQLYQKSVKMGLILADRSFPFHRWDGQKQQLVIDKKHPISAQKMFQHLTELQEMMLDKEMIVRFHALRASNPQDTKVIPWRLQINLRSDRAYDLLYQLCHNSIWMAVGATLKQHTLTQSPLASTLQTLLGKGKGKGKSKSKTNTPPKQEA